MSEPMQTQGPTYAATQPGDAPGPAQPQVVVKKYANRRLYNTESSSYITLDNLADMVRKGRDFVVYDAKSGDDITRSVLTQIIVEEEGKGRALLPTGFLRQLIGFYGDNMQSLVPKYLEQAMGAFAHQQEQMRRAMQQTMGSFFPFDVEEVTRQNRVMMERAMGMFTPFYRAAEQAQPGFGEPPPAPPPPHAGAAPESGSVAPAGAEVAALRAEIERLRGELAHVQAAALPAPQAPQTPPAGPGGTADPPTASKLAETVEKPTRRVEKAAKN